jgi:N-acetylglucosaminyldiphosphoundecaprenol N-acetyl-beta-D-mannosaminyltransferase
MSQASWGLGRIRIGTLPVDRVDLAQALDAVDALVIAKQGGRVFTPNVDHVVQAERDLRFRAAYASASLSLVDGVPLLWAARLLKTPFPEKVSGSDFFLPLMKRAAERGHRVYFLGGAAGAAEVAKGKLLESMPRLQIVGTDPALIDVNASPAAQAPILQRIAEVKPDLVLVALGAPKQEIWSFEHRVQLGPVVAVGVGASLDFVAGTQRRAPVWMSAHGLEWAFRLGQDPRRLAKRYLLRDPQFFEIVARQIFAAG